MPVKFRYFCPTAVYAGKDVLKQKLPALVAGQRVFIVTGKSSAAACGALRDALEALEQAGCPCAVYSGVENNPTLANCMEGAAQARAFGAQAVLGIGGGSPLDAAKAVAVLVTNPELTDVFGGHTVPALPIYAVPTTAGTGSEVTQYSIMTIKDGTTKKSFAGDDLFPRAAFLDAAYTASLPVQIAADTACDAISHAVESILTPSSNAASETFALESLRVLSAYAPVIRQGADEEARLNLLWGACLAGVAIAQTGTSLVHALGYSLTCLEGVPHGRANGMLLASFLKRCSPVCSQKVEKILQAMGLPSVEAFDGWMRELLQVPNPGEAKAAELAAIQPEQRKLDACPFPAGEEVRKAIYLGR